MGFFCPSCYHTKREDTDIIVCKARLPPAESNGAHVRFTRDKNCRVFSVLYSVTVELAWSITHPSRMFFVVLILFAATVGLPWRAYASSNPLDLNGGSCLVMAGKDCVAMAVDRRFGLEEQLVSAEAKRVLKINGQLLCGFTGLCTDVMTVMQDLSFEVALKAIAQNNRPISPAALAGLLSTLLYARRGSPFFVEPVIAGLDSRGKPFLCGQDILGACVETDDFVVAGTSANSLYGTCEAFFRVGMDKEELFRAAARCLLSALERDCLSGYGAVVHLITKDGIETREVTTRMD